MAFPSAQLLSAAASLFEERAPARDGSGFRVDDEGPAPFLEFGPGMVRFGRVDHARRERSTSGVFDVFARAERAQGEDEDDAGMGSVVGRAAGGGDAAAVVAVEGRGAVVAWSRKSQAGLIRKVASLDLAPLVEGALPPGMVTLTLPGDWRAVCPDAATGAAIFHRWARAYERRWGALRCIWKREFQRRGAPHWHLWLVPPGEGGGLAAYREWLSSSWTAAVFGGGGDPDERARHLRAGTGLDFAEGLRARDPRRLAVYFLKESGVAGEGKAYQNAPPAEWAGQSVGRYWGVRGIPVVTERVELAPMVAHRLWRAMRKSAEARRAPAVLLVPRGARSDGTVRFRRVTRRRHHRGPAGWLAVNDGAAAASQLARYWGQLVDELSVPREQPDPVGAGVGAGRVGQ